MSDIKVHHLSPHDRRLALAGALWMQRYIGGAEVTIDVSGPRADMGAAKWQADTAATIKKWVNDLDVPTLLGTALVAFDPAPDVAMPLAPLAPPQGGG